MTDQATAQTASRANKPSHAGAMVTVACKMETGLRLRVYKMVDDREPSPMGAREIKIARFDREVWVNGVAKRFEVAPLCEMVAGYAFTRGIPRDVWDRWVADNIDSPMVVNELIFAHEDADYLRGWCRERESRLSGMQPLSGGEDPRAPRAKLLITDEDGRAKASPRQAA